MGQVPSGWLFGISGALILLSCLWNAASVAYTLITNARAQDLIDDGRKGAQRVAHLVEHRPRTLAWCQAYRVALQVGATACLTLALVGLNLPWWGALIWALVVSGLALLIFATFAASSVARRYPEAVALRLSALVDVGVKVGKTFTFTGGENTRFQPKSSEATLRQEVVDDLRELADEVSDDAPLELEEQDLEMVRGVMELGSTLVRELVVPRTEMVTLSASQTIEEALELFNRSGFSRIPVVGEGNDDVRGVLYLKDLLGSLLHRPEIRSYPVHQYMQEAYFVPELTRADNLLAAMRTQAPHLALVVDEWGGIVGLVTFEDVVEELIGEVKDEHDRQEPQPVRQSDGRLLVPAHMNAYDLGRLIGVELDDEEVDTVSGLLSKALGKVPLASDSAEIDGIRLEVARISRRRKQAAWLWVEKLEKETQEDE